MGFIGRLNRAAGYLFLALVSATVIAAVSVSLTYRAALQASEESLRLLAMGIAVSLEAALSDSGGSGGRLFSDIMTEGRWEGIAFISLSDPDGKILMHSNPQLAGRQTDDVHITEVTGKGLPVQDSLMLGTGEKVFILYFPVHFKNSNAVLKLALHRYPAEKIIRQARTQVGLISVLVMVLWVLSYFFHRAMKQAELSEKTLKERQQMAVLGEMAATLAHEIRNPLGSIKGFAQILLEQTDTDNNRPGRTRGQLEVIVSEAARLEGLTDDLLLYARPEQVSVSSFELQLLIKEVISSIMMHESVEKGIRWKIDVMTGFQITTDRDKLRQMLINLICNCIDAVKNIDERTAEIRIEALKLSDRRNCIIISDNGEGMTAAVAENALQPFFTTRARGTGLGLAIVVKLAGLLGGSVELRSVPHKGTEVRLLLPESTI